MRISKRLFKRIAIGFGLLIGLAVVINGILAWEAQHRLDARIAEIRAAGDPALLSDLAPAAPIASNLNGATFIEGIGQDLQRFSGDLAKFYNSPLGIELDATVAKRRVPNLEQQASLRRILDRYSAVLPAIQKAAECKRYVSPHLDFSLSPMYFMDRIPDVAQTMRLPADFVRQEMLVLTAEGKSDDAVRMGVQALRLARLCDQEPLLICHLVSLTGRGLIFRSIDRSLRHERIDPDVRSKLDAELALHDTLAPLRAAMNGERAFWISLAVDQTHPIFLKWAILNRMLESGGVDDYELAISTLRQPVDKIQHEWDASRNRYRWPQLEAHGQTAAITAMTGMLRADFNQLALARCLRVVNALGAYRARAGKEAESIEQLSLPREAIIDPCTGKPLGMKKTDAGWIVYSNYRGIDEGGKYHSEDGPWGFGPPGYEAEQAK
jgi:hypothetical protein